VRRTPVNSMALRSLKRRGESVVMLWPTISMAWFWRPCLRTNASEATMAHAAPSEVGQHMARVIWRETGNKCSRSVTDDGGGG
jgi:hypothetical protein